MYEPSRHIDTFFIAGFQHYDGALVLSRLAPGCEIDLVTERDNPYDADAVALCYEGVKLGYIPRDKNSLVSLMLFYGHESAFSCRVMQVSPESDPWEQVRVGLYVTDNRPISE